jgi:hypothetical protein
MSVTGRHAMFLLGDQATADDDQGCLLSPAAGRLSSVPDRRFDATRHFAVIFWSESDDQMRGAASSTVFARISDGNPSWVT